MIIKCNNTEYKEILFKSKKYIISYSKKSNTNEFRWYYLEITYDENS